MAFPVSSRVTLRAFALLASFLLLLLAFLLFVRPWFGNWGTTADERRRPLPGDSIIANAAAQGTRAITIDAPVERVWAWLSQTGQNRSGFYSYDLLENLVGCQMPIEDRLHPEQQHWRLGDKLWMYPPHRAGGIGFATLKEYVPGRALGFATRAVGTPLSAPEDGSWSFVLEPLGRSRTRLLIRGRMAPGRSWAGRAFDRLFFEPVHFVMERRMMIGLKELAERSSRQRLTNHAQTVFWTITFVAFVFSGATVLARPAWRRPLCAFATAGVVFGILTLVQPGLVIGGAAAFVAVAAAFPSILMPSRLLQP